MVDKMANSETASFRFKRIVAWLHPEEYVSDTGYQTLQAIGSGGIWGKGLGQSMQKLGFIPEAQNDMICSIICEELGLFGAIAIILMFVMLIWRLMVIANNAPDLFGTILSGARNRQSGNSGYLKHSRYGNHSQYRYFHLAPFISSRRYRGVVPACRRWALF